MKSTATVYILLALAGASTAFAAPDGTKVESTKINSPQQKLQSGVHQTSAVVKAIDVANGKVTLAHGAIASLNWPPMTMGFAVKDKQLFDKLVVGRTVNVELVKEGPGYVVTAVR
jgi:Cu(I)/Ag(I) efflux system protein CusF